MLLIYKGSNLIYSSDKNYQQNDFFYSYVTGMINMANHFYNDSVFYIENEEIGISLFRSLSDAFFLYLSKERKQIDMKYFYKLYSLAVLYGDINLMDDFINK